MNRPLLVFASVALFVACGPRFEPEESITIFDPSARARFIALLDEKDVPYRMDSGGQVFYPVSSGQEISEAKDAVMGPVDKTARGAMTKAIYAEEIAARLTESNIQFELIRQDQTAIFEWDATHDKRALAIVSEILKRHGA